MKTIKKWILIFIAILLSINIYSQQQVMNMAIDATLNSNDWFYVVNQGTTDRRMSGTTLMTAVSDSMYIFRLEVYDSIAAIRAIALGGGVWSKSGNFLYPTSTDSVGIGTSVPAYRLDVNGNSRVTGSFRADTVIFPSSGTAVAKMYRSGDDLVFLDNNNAATTLTNLNAGLFSLVTTTYYPTVTTSNWNFGGNSATTYKVKVTGTFNTTSHIYNGGYLYFAGIGGAYGSPHPGIYAYGDTLEFFDESGTYSLSTLASGGTGIDSAATIGLIGDVLDTTEFTFEANPDVVGDTLMTVYQGDVGYWVNPWLKSGATLRPTADTIQFDDGSQVRRGASNTVELFPYNTGGREVVIKDVNSKVILNTTVLELTATDTTYGAAGRMVYKTNGKYYGYDATTSTWTEFGEGGGGEGTVTTSGSPLANQAAYFTAASIITGSSIFTFPAGVPTITNTAPVGFYVNNSGTTGIGVANTGTGKGIESTNTNANGIAYKAIASAGTAFQATDGTDTIFTIDKDSVYFDYLAKPGGSSENWFFITQPNGAGDTGTTENARLGLIMDLESIGEFLSDTVNGEVKWYWIEKDINGKDSIVMAYDLPQGINAIEALQIATELNMRWIDGLDKKVDKLDKRVSELEKNSGNIKTAKQSKVLYIVCGLLIVGFVYHQLKIRKTIIINKHEKS